MPFDAICISAVREELAEKIIGKKIDKIRQPERDMLIISLRGGQGGSNLLISAGVGDARVHLTDTRFENPPKPPMFCMLLRKHLLGAKVVDIVQPQSERVIIITLLAADSFGVYSEKKLTVELIGHSANIILTGSDGIIIDCLRRVGSVLTDKRCVLPGLFYKPPIPQEGKTDFLCLTNELWRRIYDDSNAAGSVDKWLLSVFSGLSPLICRELSWRVFAQTDFQFSKISDNGESLKNDLFRLLDKARARDFEPFLIIGTDGVPLDFSFIPIKQYESGGFTLRKETSFSKMLDIYYTQTALIRHANQRNSATRKLIKNARDKITRKLVLQNEQLNKTSDREYLRECGDIIKANLHLMTRGQSLLEADDFYADPGVIRKIKLDPTKTPQQNAAKYYKDYAKAKNSIIHLTEQIQIGERERVYLESVLEALAMAESESDLQEIRDELMKTGYIKVRKQLKGKQHKTAHMRFVSSGGFTIYAGKNNIQNEGLTFKTASRTDIWLHTQKIHGSHVVIVCNGALPDETTLYEAAMIAVYYSAARSSGKTAVDYTLIKNVKKQPGGRPGMVYYTDYKTIIAEPDEEVVNRIRS